MRDFSWRLAAPSDPAPLGSLILDRVSSIELALDADALAEALAHGRDVREQLHGGPIPLTEKELAVYRLVQPRIGIGAFAAALAGVIPPQKLKVVAFHDLDPTQIRDGQTAGFLHDVPTMPPVIGLRQGEREHDCLVLTWSGTWAAMRCYLRSARITFALSGFTEHALKHPGAVESLLPVPKRGDARGLR